MDSSPRPEVVRDDWKYNGKLRYKDIPRGDASKLRKLLFPEDCPASEDEDTTVVHGEWEPLDVLDRNFAVAQLSHYGLSFPGVASEDTMLRLLRDGLLAGKCDQVPPEVQAIEDELRAQYTPLKEAYDLEQKQERLSKMELQDDFTTKATIGQELFVSRYFQDGDDRPDKTKTPHAITVPPLWAGDSLAFKIRGLAEKVPGLISKIERIGGCHVLFLGWTDGTVNKARDEYTIRHATRESEADTPFELHQEKTIVAKHEADMEGFREQAYKPQASITGKYVISCPEIEGRWDLDENLDLTLEIHATRRPGVYTAEFQLGILEGVMILSADRAKLAGYRGELHDFSKSSDDEDGDDDDNSGEEPNPTARETPTKKRKVDAGEEPLAPSKRTKTSGVEPLAHPLKYWLGWRGCDTGSGETVLGCTDSGYIEFDDQDLVRFSGNMEITFLDQNGELSGRKISEDPGKRNRTWNDYS